MKTKVILLAILFLGIFYRLYALGIHPSILNRDEAALAYNAYLLLETGKDEWSQAYPLYLESFGDFKLVGYALSIIPFIALLPFSDIGVKLPSALAGVALIIITYFITRRITNNKQLISYSILAIATAPVFIFYSRIAFEANLALVLALSGIYLLFLEKKNTLSDILSVLLLFCAAITYNTPLLLMPFLLPLIVLNRGLKKPKDWLLPIISLLLVTVFLFIQLVPVTQQKSAITIFNDEELQLQANEYYQNFPPVLRPVLGNRVIFFAGQAILRFVESFSYPFFISKGGGHPWHSLPHWGNAYLIVYILGLIGIFTLTIRLFKKMFISKNNYLTIITIFKEEQKSLFLLYALLVSLLPSITTVDAPHTTRSLFFIFVFYLFSIFGLEVVMQQAKRINIKKEVVAALTYVTLLLYSVFYFKEYLQKYPTRYNSLYEADYKRVLSITKQEHEDKKVAVVDESGYLYIITAWYLQLEASTFFSTVVRQQPNTFGFKYGEQVGNVHFIADKKDVLNNDEKILLYTGKNSTWYIEER